MVKKTFEKGKEYLIKKVKFKRRWFKPWWLPYRFRFFRKRNKFQWKEKKNKVFRKYRFSFKKKRKQLYRIKLKKVFTMKLLAKKLLNRLYNTNLTLKKNKVNHYRKLFIKIANRLDVIVAKNYNIRTIKQAHKSIKAGLVYVNNKQIKKINYEVQPLNVIHLKRDAFPWKIKNLAFKYRRKKRPFNCYISRKSSFLILHKIANLKYSIPLKFLSKKVFKVLVWYDR